MGLAAKSSVAGRSAALARGSLYLEIAGVAVRLFKYLISAYYDEFVFSVNEWVLRDLLVLPASGADKIGQASPPRLTEQKQGRVGGGGPLARPGRDPCRVVLFE